MTKFTLTLIAALGMYCTLQAQSLRGTISDAQGNPLTGASVVADGTNGQFADTDGAYVLSLSPGTHTVQFSYIGYIRQTKEVTCLLYTSPSPRDRQKNRMPSSA